ncbi:adenine deaminase C-terminal domain-containing protein [Haladaptatus salinisoli]|uniref:adenine deaminase C-terminal domain-containing protein n=1 Tax=Haladaptatus salinisoli TaxID=2884876 RepID=UPI001D0A390A|nr:adenine deaminase C-terminal domain-containing protein [Haladaptatus salinisoli]
MNDLQPVALGDEPADLVIRDGRVLLPEPCEFQARDVAIKNNRVAALPEDATDAVGEDTKVINASDRVVVPGFIDAHTHIDLHQTFENAYHYALEGGTTTVVTEVTGFGPAFGREGVEQLLAATSYLPIRVYATVPPQPVIDTFEPARADVDALAELVDDPRIVGIGETDWIHAVGRDTNAEVLYDRANREGKTVSGHGAGCSGAKLQAFASVVDDDHEAITGDEIVERVENGIHAIGRYGSIRDDMSAVGEAYEAIGASEISLSTDGMWPRQLVREGYMDVVVRRAIEEGVPPADAIRMATLNPARHFGLPNLGSLAPGNVADVLLIDDLETVNVTTVISGGEVVYNNHETTVAPRSYEYPERFYDSVNVSTDPDEFRVPAAEGAVRAIEYRGGLLSAETTVEPPVEDGELVAAPEDGLLKVALFDRHPDGDGTGFTGFLTGYGAFEGAVATSLVWEVPGVLAAGSGDDLRRAVAHVNEMGGGWAVVKDGDVVAELPTRVGGVCSDLEVEETAKLYGAIESALRTLGAEVERPMLALQTLTFPGVPSLKLSFSGYADIFSREIVGLRSE